MAKTDSIEMLKGGFSPTVGGSSIPFIQFADDSLFMLKADPKTLRMLQSILLILKVVTELKVNLYKSSLSPVKRVPNLEEFASLIGCQMAALLISCLGLVQSYLESGSKENWIETIALEG